MATITYTTTITQVDESTINLAIANLTASPITPVLSTFQNMITGVSHNMLGSFMTSPLPNSFDLDSTVASMGAVFGDAVYYHDASFTGGGDGYFCEEYFLKVTAIDAGIAALPQTTLQEIAIYDYAVAQRADIQVAFDGGFWGDANTLIILLTNLIVDGEQVGATLLFALTLTGGGVTINTEIADADFHFVDAGITPVLYVGGYLNYLTNTLTLVVYEYTFNYDLTLGTPQDYDITQVSVYPDGVYTNYSSVMTSWDDAGDFPAMLSTGLSYVLVTTTIDAQIVLFEANLLPDDTAGAIALAEMLANQAAWIVAYAANDYTETNALIAATQAILANGINVDLFAALTSDADMNVYFESLPAGTYTSPTGTITNTLTGVAFTFDGFPSSVLDLATILNSETLGFGADFPDGVYQIVVNFYVDGLLFIAQCYLPVTTDWQCCIDKAAGKKCGKLNTALMQANLTNAVRLVSIYSDVDTANALISEGNRECSSCGCGCS